MVSEFKTKLDSFAKGNIGRNDMNELLNTLEKHIATIDKKDQENLLLKLSAEVGKVEDPDRDDFSKFIMDFSMWVYNWKKKISPTKEEIEAQDVDTCEL